MLTLTGDRQCVGTVPV